MHSQPRDQTSMKRNVIAIAVGLALAAGTAIAIAVHEPGEALPAQPTPSLTVNVVSPTSTKFDRVIAGTGTVTARDELIIGSDASGVRLTEVLVEIGSVVRKGDLLARGDDAQLRAQLAQFEASLKQAQVDHAQAEINLERTDRLKDSGVYSVETMQSRRTTAAAAAAKVELVRAQVRELEVRIAQTRVVAPAAGVISKKLATVGAVVQPGTELFRLIKNGELEWLAELPGHSMARLAPGVAVRVMLDDGRAVDAKVRLIAPTMDAKSRNGLVHVSLPPGTPLKAGQHASGEILIDDAQALALPEASVLMRDGYPFVYLVGPDNVVRLAKIQTGSRRNGWVEVNAGLNPNARVVSTGAGFLKDGDLVRVSPASSLNLAQSEARS